MATQAKGATQGRQGAQEAEDESVSEEVSRQVFSTYECKSIDRGIVHPGDIAEPSSLRCAIHGARVCAAQRLKSLRVRESEPLFHPAAHKLLNITVPL